VGNARKRATCSARHPTQAMDNIGSATLLTELRASHVSTAKNRHKPQPTQVQTRPAFTYVFCIWVAALCLIMSYLYIYSKHSKIGVPNYIPNTAKQGKAFQTQENTGSKHNSTVHFSAF